MIQKLKKQITKDIFGLNAQLENEGVEIEPIEFNLFKNHLDLKVAVNDKVKKVKIDITDLKNMPVGEQLAKKLKLGISFDW